MGDIIDRLSGNKDSSSSKSYFIGLERGRTWAEDADYFELRQWSEMTAEQFDDLTLPEGETDQFMILNNSTSLEWKEYLKGWLEGVKEIRKKF